MRPRFVVVPWPGMGGGPLLGIIFPLKEP
jgi:hypothetical protein